MATDLSGLLWGMKLQANRGTIVELRRGEGGFQAVIAADDCGCRVGVGQSSLCMPASWRPSLGDVVETMNIYRDGAWTAVSVTLVEHAAARAMPSAEAGSACDKACQENGFSGTAVDCLDDHS